MFAKPEDAVAPSQPAIPTPASPGLRLPGANGSNDEDKQGFQRIVQMLGGANISAPQQLAPSGPVPGPRAGGGIPLDFHTQSPPEERPDEGPGEEGQEQDKPADGERTRKVRRSKADIASAALVPMIAAWKTRLAS